jgi:hypothetical protein
MLLRAGWSEEEASQFMVAITQAAGDEELRQRVRDVMSTKERLDAGRTATGAPALTELVGTKVVGLVRIWLGIGSDFEIIEPPLSETPSWPDPLAAEAFHGLAGEIVNAIEPHSEADPAALLIQFLVAYGNVVGRAAHFRVEADLHYTNLFAVVVGATSKARKGTSWSQVERLIESCDSVWTRQRIHSGLTSGEGLIWAVRDPIERRPKNGKVELVDEGVADKRLLVLETEFASTLRATEREGNTLSPVIREAWDRGRLQCLTKNSPARVTDAHISIVAHISRHELLRRLNDTEVANGFANRFLFICARRSKLLPEGGALDFTATGVTVERLRRSIQFATSTRSVVRDDRAREIWIQVYGPLSEGRPGLLGAVTSRAEAQLVRLSLIYALLDCSPVITEHHLLAALSVWDYADASARSIFGDALGDPTADEILRALRAHPEGLTRTEIRDLFRRHKREVEIDRALSSLSQLGLAFHVSEDTGGRSTERWSSSVPAATKATKATKGGLG